MGNGEVNIYEKEIVEECVGCDNGINREIRGINRLYNIKYDYECIECLSDTLEIGKAELLDEGMFWVYADKRKCIWDDVLEEDELVSVVID